MLQAHLRVKERLLGDDDGQQLQEGGGSCPSVVAAPVVHTRQLASHGSQNTLQDMIAAFIHAARKEKLLLCLHATQCTMPKKLQAVIEGAALHCNCMAWLA